MLHLVGQMGAMMVKGVRSSVELRRLRRLPAAEARGAILGTGTRPVSLKVSASPFS